MQNIAADWVNNILSQLFKCFLLNNNRNLFSEQADQGYLIEYVPLLYNASIELAEILIQIFTAPRYIYEELFQANQWQPNALQNVSLCGRKMVAWSEKIAIADVKKIGNKKKLDETELYFSSASAALNVFLDELKGDKSHYLGVCAQYMGNEYLLGNKAYKKGKSKIIFFKQNCSVFLNGKIFFYLL